MGENKGSQCRSLDSRIHFIETSDDNDDFQELREGIYRSREDVIKMIQELHDKAKPLNIVAVKRRYPALMAFVYNQNPFWGWRQALADAGISYDTISIELLTLVTCKVCGEQFKQLQSHLRCKHEMSGDEYLHEFGANTQVLSEEQRYKRQINAACNRECGYPHWEPFYTLEYVLDRLHYYHNCGLSLHRRAVVKYDSGVAGGAYKYYNNWDDILRLISLDPEKIHKVVHQHWSQDAVIEKLKERSRKGLPLNGKHLRLDDENLYVACRAYFGHFSRALEFAGFNPEEISIAYPDHTDEEYAEMLQEMRRIIALPYVERKPVIGVAMKKYRPTMVSRHKAWKGFAHDNNLPFWKFLNAKGTIENERETLRALDDRYFPGITMMWLKDNSFTLFKKIKEYFTTLQNAVELMNNHKE